MNQRTIVRSLTTNDGTLVAMNDGVVSWKPREGRAMRTKLEGLPTVLLAMRPMGPVDATAIGCADGNVVRPDHTPFGNRCEVLPQFWKHTGIDAG